MRRLTGLLALLVSCTTAAPPPAATKPAESGALNVSEGMKLAPKDEPAQILASFESPDELRTSHNTDVDLAFVSEGATQGAQAIKITAADKPHPEKTRDGKGIVHGLRLNFVPAQSWAELSELALDVTNPEGEAQHFMVSLLDSTNSDPDHRRKANFLIPPHTSETIRVPLSDAAPSAPPGQRTGVTAHTNGVDIDLTGVKAMWMLMDRSKPGQSLIVDNVRLVKRDAGGVAIAPKPKNKLPHVAVLDLVDVTGDLGPRAKVLTTLVYDTCAAAKTSEVISSAEINEMLGAEKQKELLGCTDSSCLAEIGGALGSDYLLTSQVGKLGSRQRIDVRLIDARKAKVLASAGDFVSSASDDGLADGLTHLVKQVLHDSPLAPATTANP